jgi:hypothetical protein
MMQARVRQMYLLAAAVVGIIVATTAVGFSQAKPSASIQGVWKVVEIVTTGANPATNANPQPSLYIFTNRHYSLISVNGTQVRPDVQAAKDPAKLTDAEKLARYEMWNSFSANSGTYEVKGTTLTRRPLVAKNVNVMTGPPVVAESRLEGNTLTLTAQSASGQPVSETRTTLTRVE